MRTLIVGLAICLAFAAPAPAATLVNGSFETGTNPGGGFLTVGGGNTTAITGWTVGGHSVDYIGGYWQASNGGRSIDLAGSGIGSIAQSFATTMGNVYTVTFDIARNPDGGTMPRTGTVDIGGPTTLLSFANSASTRPNMLWESRAYTFTATSALTTLRFSADASSNGFFGLALDNVALSAVPEPATWMMMILGFGLIGGAMRRRAGQGAALPA